MPLRLEEVNFISGRVVLGLSVLSLLTVLSGFFQAPQSDEGAAAHIFQLALIALLPAILLFLTTLDWSKNLRSLRLLAYSAVALLVAFGTLYYLEHYFYLARHQ
jgi:hypothetical protein